MPILSGAKNLNAVSRIVILKKKALKIMNFQSRDSPLNPLFKSINIFFLSNHWLQGKTIYSQQKLIKII